MPDFSLDQLRRKAKRLRKSYEAGDADAIAQLRAVFDTLPDPLRHADYLHVIARQLNFTSWPKLKFAAEQVGLDRLAKQRLLRHALYSGHHWKVAELLRETPDLPVGDLACQISLYDLKSVQMAITEDPLSATRDLFGKHPVVHLAFSRHLQAAPDKQEAMLAVADLLLSHGADANDFQPAEQSGQHSLSVLYGAIGHANNVGLARKLLEAGADPNDGESLYHSVELGHQEGLRLLLEHGADPNGTNTLPRALDFNDHEAVRLLLDAGASPDDFNSAHVGGEAPYVIPALHQAARRMNDRAMIELLLNGGADPFVEYQGVSAYIFGRVIGNHALCAAIEERGLGAPLSEQEQMLADAADGKEQKGVYLDVSKLPECFRQILTELITLPGRFDHINRLVSIGIEFDRPDDMGVPPVQTAGWNGLPDVMAYLLELGPDLTHVNKYGGTLLGTILHGAEHCPSSEERDHVECTRLALHHGLLIPKAALQWSGHQELAAFLRQWAEDKPSQVV